MDPRPYTKADEAECLEIFDTNTPTYFAPTERKSFEDFLATQPPTYFVLQHDRQILGAGGYCLSDNGAQANLTWGMIRQDLHKQGLGRFLLMYRLREIAKANTVQTVRVGTSQLTAAFFEKQGFKLASIQKDGYAPGLDRVELLKKLTVCP